MNAKGGLTYLKQMEGDYQRSEIASLVTKCKRPEFGSASTFWYKMQSLMASCAFDENYFLSFQ